MIDLSIVVNRQHQIRDRRGWKNSRGALRAITGARLCASGQAETPAVAAACTGSTLAYVRAGITLLKSEDGQLLDQVLCGGINILQAAKAVRRVADLVDAYRGASEQDLVKAAKVIGRIHAPYVTAAE